MVTSRLIRVGAVIVVAASLWCAPECLAKRQGGDLMTLVLQLKERKKLPMDQSERVLLKRIRIVHKNTHFLERLPVINLAKMPKAAVGVLCPAIEANSLVKLAFGDAIRKARRSNPKLAADQVLLQAFASRKVTRFPMSLGSQGARLWTNPRYLDIGMCTAAHLATLRAQTRPDDTPAYRDALKPIGVLVPLKGSSNAYEATPMSGDPAPDQLVLLSHDFGDLPRLGGTYEVY